MCKSENWVLGKPSKNVSNAFLTISKLGFLKLASSLNLISFSYSSSCLNQYKKSRKSFIFPEKAV